MVQKFFIPPRLGAFNLGFFVNGIEFGDSIVTLTMDRTTDTHFMTRFRVLENGTVQRASSQPVTDLFTSGFVPEMSVTVGGLSDSVLLYTESLRRPEDLDQALLTVVQMKGGKDGGSVRHQIEVADGLITVLPNPIGFGDLAYLIEDRRVIPNRSVFTLHSVQFEGGVVDTQLAQISDVPQGSLPIILEDQTVWLNTRTDLISMTAPEGQAFNGRPHFETDSHLFAMGNRIVELFDTSNDDGDVTDFAILSRDEGDAVVGGRIAGGRGAAINSGEATFASIHGVGFAVYREVLSTTSDDFRIKIDVIDMDGDRIGTLDMTAGIGEHFSIKRLVAHVTGGQIVLTALGSDESIDNTINSVGYSEKLRVALNLTGTDASDVLTGLSLSDVLDGGDGNDSIFTGFGNDSAFGGDGLDFIVGKGGEKDLRGGADDDGFLLFSGHHLIFGGDGNDEVDLKGSGDSEVFGGDGNDTVFGGTGAGKYIGDAGDDDLRGEKGNDTLRGDDGSDTLKGGEGNDRLFDDSRDAIDFLFGGRNADHLHTHGGNDSLLGGEGVDRFFIESGNDALITIADFNQGPERIVFDRFVAKSRADLSLESRADGTLISLDDGLTILVLGIETMTGRDFIFE